MTRAWPAARLAVTAGVLVLGCGDDPAVTPPPPGPAVDVDFHAWLADPYAPARRPPGQARLASSREPEDPSGMLNDDFDHFVRREGRERVLIDEEGPGAILRMWFTWRGDVSFTFDPDVDARLHLYVDGAEVEIDGDGDRGVRFSRLLSGDLPGFPAPWVLGPEDASGGSLVGVPIHFAERVKVSVEVPDDIGVYYQIDWRRLPDGSAVRSFDGVPDAGELASLEAASDLWVGRNRGGDETTASMEIAPGESVSVSVGPGVVRRLVVDRGEARADDLTARLVVDGDPVVEAPVGRLMFGASPVTGFTSALAAVDGAELTLAYPFPARTGATLEIRNDGASPASVGATIALDPGPPPDDLGGLRVRCGRRQDVTRGDNTLVLEADGRGHFAGLFLVMRASMWGWTMLEGDHEIEIDGQWRVLGTGVEDYFGGAFYFINGPFAHPTVGLAGWDDHVDRPQAAMFRHHLADGYEFDEGLRYEYEVFVDGTDFEHCAFWYAR